MAEIELGKTIDGPGTHALVIGVSRYPYTRGPLQTQDGKEYALPPLDFAARSAAEVAHWLLTEYRNPAAPLASLQVLLSPAENETIRPDVAIRLTSPYAATRLAVQVAVDTLRSRCVGHPENSVFVYIAGHGIQLTRLGAIVLLEDFGGPGQSTQLEAAVDMRTCHGSFNGYGYPNHQVWFVDSCRQGPGLAEKFDRLSGGMPFDQPSGDVDSSPLFLASSTHEEAFGQAGGMTLFSRALLAALRGEAADGPDELSDEWHIAASRLGDVIHRRVRAWAREDGRDQRVDLTGRLGPAVVHAFAHPPDVELTLELDPICAADYCTAALFFAGTEAVVSGASEWPVTRTVRAGNYTLLVDSQAPYLPIQYEPRFVRPRTFRWPVKVT